MAVLIDPEKIHNIIFASPSKSRVRNLQSIGRGLRLGDNKEEATLFDIADDFRIGKFANYTLKHFVERVKIYDEEKFNIIEKNSYVKETQKNPKEIVFSSEATIKDLFTDQELTYNKRLDLTMVSYTESSSTIYDYNFNIEEETLTEDFDNLKYSQLKINFIDLFTILSQRQYGGSVFGIMCIITINGRSINFNVLTNEARFVNVFLGKMQEGDNGAAYQVDFYAFNKDYQIFNV